MSRRRTQRAPLDRQIRTRVDATVAAHQAYYGQHGAPNPTLFRSDDDLERGRAEVRAIIEAEREAYDGPLMPRQGEPVEKRDVDRLPYRLIAEYGKIDETEVRACLAVAGSSHDEHDRERAGGGLPHRNPEAWHWSRPTGPARNSVVMEVAEAICPEAVAMIRRRVNLGTLWSAEHERAETERTKGK